MARYVIDPAGIKTKVSGTNYIPPCLVKNQQLKDEQQAKATAEPVADSAPKTK